MIHSSPRFSWIYRWLRRLNPTRLPLWLVTLAAVFGLSTLHSCGQVNSVGDQPSAIRLDYAYYNPVSLVLREQGLLEEAFAEDNISVEWTLSQGSNRSLELLNSRSVDFGSTAGAAALLGKANGNPIKAIYVYSQPEWTALVTRPDTGINQVEDLRGKRIAVTRGTDPHIFLLRALDQAGLSEQDVELVQLQHPDGRTALTRGDVDAWAGLDPHMAAAELEEQAALFFRNPDLNTYGVLNVREDFAQRYPDAVERVLTVYEQGRQWALDNPEDLAALLAQEAGLETEIAVRQLERTNFSDSVIGAVHRDTIVAAGDVLIKSDVIPADTNVAQVVDDLIDAQYIETVAARS